MRIITRKQSGLRPPKWRHIMTKTTSEVWLHHTAGAEDLGNNGRWLDDVKQIQDFHMDERGWSDIAYSFLVDSSGQVWEGRGARVVGGHTRGRNRISHGIACIGNFEENTPSDEMIDAVVWLLNHGEEQGWWLGRRITGPHSSAPGASTLCCGKHLRSRIPEINFLADLNRLPQPSTTKETSIVSNIPANRIPVVEASQKALAEAGYYTLKIDGDHYHGTHKAILAALADAERGRNVKPNDTHVATAKAIIADPDFSEAVYDMLDKLRNDEEG